MRLLVNSVYLFRVYSARLCWKEMEKTFNQIFQTNVFNKTLMLTLPEQETVTSSLVVQSVNDGHDKEVIS